MGEARDIFKTLSDRKKNQIYKRHLYFIII